MSIVHLSKSHVVGIAGLILTWLLAVKFLGRVFFFFYNSPSPLPFIRVPADATEHVHLSETLLCRKSERLQTCQKCSGNSTLTFKHFFLLANLDLQRFPLPQVSGF